MKICALLVALIMVFSQGGIAEALLPSVGEVLDVRMPSLSCVLNRYPDKDETLADGSDVLTYNGVTEEQFNKFSDYLSLYGCTLADYTSDNGNFEATVEYQGKTFSFTYDAGQQIATVTYPQGTAVEQADPLMLAQIGDIVSFGHYEQDNNPDNGEEEISWIVVGKDRHKCKLLALYGLDTKPFHNTNDDTVTWESCDLRTWLNDTFYNSAFSEVEKSRIIDANVCMYENTEYMYYSNDKDKKGWDDNKQCEDTTDKVYVPSATEIYTYFEEQEGRGAQATPYAIAQGGYSDAEEWDTANSWYWLRTRDGEIYYDNVICCVSPDGRIGGSDYSFSLSGRQADVDFITVRPVINVRYNMSEALAAINIVKKFDPADNYTTIAAGDQFAVALRNDGTVVGAGIAYDYDVSGWTDIAALAAGNHHIVGLRGDGTVVAVGNNDFGECDVTDWTDIVAVATGGTITVGVHSDGTVVATGKNEYGECNVSEWTDIVAVAAGDRHTVGLRSDGTVVATGYNEHGGCDVSEWTDIVAVAAGPWHTVGLRSDGTILGTSLEKGHYDDSQSDVSDWTDDIVAVAVTNGYTVGLRGDGTVVGAGWYADYGRNDVSEWTDIVAVAAGWDFTLGLRSDGTVLVVGDDVDQSDVSDWTDIRLPADIPTDNK